MMRRPQAPQSPGQSPPDTGNRQQLVDSRPSMASSGSSTSERMEAPPPILYVMDESPFLTRKQESKGERERRIHKQVILRVLQHVRFIADHFRALEEEEEVCCWSATFIQMYSSHWTRSESRWFQKVSEF